MRETARVLDGVVTPIGVQQDAVTAAASDGVRAYAMLSAAGLHAIGAGQTTLTFVTDAPPNSLSHQLVADPALGLVLFGRTTDTGSDVHAWILDDDAWSEISTDVGVVFDDVDFCASLDAICAVSNAVFFAFDGTRFTQMLESDLGRDGAFAASGLRIVDDGVHAPLVFGGSILPDGFLKHSVSDAWRVDLGVGALPSVVVELQPPEQPHDIVDVTVSATIASPVGGSLETFEAAGWTSRATHDDVDTPTALEHTVVAPASVAEMRFAITTNGTLDDQPTAMDVAELRALIRYTLR